MRELEPWHQPEVPEENVIDKGGTSELRRVTVEVKSKKPNKPGRLVQMVVRSPKSEIDSYRLSTMADQYKSEAEKHDLMRKVKIPGKYLIPTVRFDGSDPNSPKLYETDLSESGKKSVFSVTSLSRQNLIAESSGGRAVENSDEILSQMVSMAKVCAEKRVRFRNQDIFYFIVDRQNHKGRVIIGDYKYAWIDKKDDYKGFLLENLLTARDAVLVISQLLGLSREKIYTFFEENGLNEE
jgi:hypothetical protein